MLLYRLGNGLRAHFERCGDIDALKLSLTRLDLANRLTPLSHAEKPMQLVALGMSLRTRFERLGQLEDLELALALHRLAVYLTPEGALNRPVSLTECGNTLRTRYQRLGAFDNLEQSVILHEKAIELTPEVDSDMAAQIASLATFYGGRFWRFRDEDDLWLAHYYRAEAEHKPARHPDRSYRLANLAVSLGERYRRHGELEDLERTISIEELALELTPEGHYHKPARLENLAVTLGVRYKRYNELEDLERAISMEELALELTPEGHPDKPERLSNLAVALGYRYDRHGELEDLERAIDLKELALRLTPEDHPDKPARLANLAVSLGDRYNRHRDLEDLERAIDLKELAIKFTPEDHPDLPARLENLAASLRVRNRRQEDLEELERAISIQELTLELMPEGHPDEPGRLASLATSLEDRYERHSELEDLERAIDLRESAIDLTPEGHPDMPALLASLAGSLWIRSKRPDEPGDLERVAISDDSGEEDDRSTPEVWHRPITSHSQMMYLERAIRVGYRSVKLTSESDSSMPERLANLGGFIFYCYELWGGLRDLERSISMREQAVRITPEGHPDKATRLYDLGLAFWNLFLTRKSKSRFDAIIDCFMKAATQSLGDPSHRLDAAKKCVLLLSEYIDFGSAESLLLAHSRIIQVLPEIVWLGHSVDRRFEESGKLGLGSLVNDAASAFIHARSRHQAIVWMETGRSLVWSQITSMRAPPDEKLAQMHPSLASDLRKVLTELARSGNTSLSSLQHSTHLTDTSQSLHSEGTMSHGITLEDIANRHRRLVIRYESILKGIRSHWGFENFMRSPGIDSLLPRIEDLDGPVVFINVHTSSCDALALFSNGAMTHIPLPSLTESRTRSLRSTWMRCLRSSNRDARAIITHDSRVLRGGTTMFSRVLGRLWTWIVHPILEALKFVSCTLYAREQTLIVVLQMDGAPSSDRLPHITWCPTGPLTQLPLHAAGIYEITQTDRPRVFDYALSLRRPMCSSSPSQQPLDLVRFQVLMTSALVSRNFFLKAHF